MNTIVDTYSLGPGVQYMELECPLIARKAGAGQFVMVRVSENGERIPLTISDFNREKGTITLVFQEAGNTTRLLARMRSGEEVLDILGPQGNPTAIARFGTACVIGGGIGVAPLYPLAKELKEAGNRVIALLGYRSKEYVFWEEKIRGVCDRASVATNDGSYGKKGFVTDLLNEAIAGGEKIDIVFAIGPTIMMKAVAELTRRTQIKTIVSLNSLMVCGMGMCGACRVSIAGETRFTCMDGPDFNGHQVDFDELMTRLNTYKDEEEH